MGFGDVAFSGSRFVFWCTAPVLALAAVGAPFLIRDWTPQKVALVGAASTACVLAIFAIYDARRFRLAARSLTGLIFLAYLGYLVEELVFTDKPLQPTRHGEASPWNSILGFVVIGLPCLWHSVLGRFSLQAPPPPVSDAELEIEGDDYIEGAD